MNTVYALVNNENGELFYVGCTKQKYPCKRKRNHIERSKEGIRKNKCCEYIKNCNFDISLVVLEKFEGDQNKRFEREQFYIDLHKPIANTTGARSIPPFMGGNNKKRFNDDFFNLLGKMPDYKLAEKFQTNKKTVMRHRNNLKIPSYSSVSGNNGKFKNGNYPKRWLTYG